MCCPTGLCGPSIDPELLRVSTVLDTLKQHGIDVGRYNLTSAPLKFVQTKAVTDFLQYHGPEDLPLILVDGAVQFAGRYPTNDEFASLIGFDPAILEAAQAAGMFGGLLKTWRSGLVEVMTRDLLQRCEIDPARQRVHQLQHEIFGRGLASKSLKKFGLTIRNGGGRAAEMKPIPDSIQLQARDYFLLHQDDLKTAVQSSIRQP